MHEQIFVQTDKNFYLAGETMWLQAFTTNETLQRQDFSKVAYIELVNEKQSLAQAKLELKKGMGTGKLILPVDLPSGNYQLTAYTRYMKNEGEKAFFHTTIGVFNAFASSPTDRIEILSNSLIYPQQETADSNLTIVTDRLTYQSGETVTLTISQLPVNTNLTISVYRNDSIFVPNVTFPPLWKNKTKPTNPIIKTTIEGEYEGPILEGELIDLATKLPFNPKNKDITASLAIPGKEIGIYIGEVSPEGHVQFRTGSLRNVDELALVTYSKSGDSCRIDLQSPFINPLVPTTLPPLRLQASQQQALLEHSLAVQTQRIFANPIPKALADPSYYFQPYKVYDLDQYVRFNTVSETLKEYVSGLKEENIDNRIRLSIYKTDLSQYNGGATLVLLDGIPLFNHEEILKYNPHSLKYIKIYSDNYVFGGQSYSGIAAFYSKEGNLADFRMNATSQLINFEAIQRHTNGLEPVDHSPLSPDFRHTLYWNPDLQNGQESSMSITFPTSALSGDYLIQIGGLTEQGEVVYANGHFRVQ